MHLYKLNKKDLYVLASVQDVYEWCRERGYAMYHIEDHEYATGAAMCQDDFPCRTSSKSE